MSDNTAVRAAKLDKIFGTPVCAVLLAIFCNVLWGSAFPFIKLGYRLFSIDSGNTASIFCFAGVRFMLGSVLVLLGSILLQGKAPRLPRGKVAAECCALGLWQTTAQYAFYYIAVAMLTGAFGGILNSTQSFLGVIFAHFIYGNADRMTPAKTLGCAVGFAGVLIGTLGNHGSGSGWGVFCMMAATVIFTLSGPWNKSVTKKADSFAVCFLNLFVGGLALFVLGTVMGGRLHVQSALAAVVMLYLAFICGAGYILWALLMKNNPVSRIAIFGFVNPVVNVLLSAVLNGEPLELAHRYPWVVAAIGIHPESLLPAADCGEDGPAPTVSVYGGDWAAEMQALTPYYDDPKVVAVGECGLDYHWPGPKDAQLALFEAEIRLALELDKPIIVHDRQAHADVYALLKKYRPKGIVHCYSGSAEDAVQLAAQGLYIGFGGACTFNDAKRAAKAIEALPLDAIVLETDCPYMAPEPVRGTRCDSSLIRYVGTYIAQRKALAPEEVFRTTAANARRVFGL